MSEPVPSAGRALVISLHDVAPASADACARIVTTLADAGVHCSSLLVVPNHHRRGHFLEDAAFCEWLQTLASAGHEIVIHGYFHQRARRADEGVRAKLTTRFYTADEGEFYDLGREPARQLVEKARGEFEQLGLAPTGFIAPAWLLNAEAEEALRELGLLYTTRLASVRHLRTRRDLRSQSLVWSVRSAWRRIVSLGWNAQLFRRLSSNPLMRISIHPVDLAHPAIWAQIQRLTRRALRTRKALTYERWMMAQEPCGAAAHA